MYPCCAQPKLGVQLTTKFIQESDSQGQELSFLNFSVSSDPSSSCQLLQHWDGNSPPLITPRFRENKFFCHEKLLCNQESPTVTVLTC